MPSTQFTQTNEDAPVDSEFVGTKSELHMGLPKEILEAEKKSKRPADESNVQTKSEFIMTPYGMMNPMMLNFMQQAMMSPMMY